MRLRLPSQFSLIVTIFAAACTAYAPAAVADEQSAWPQVDSAYGLDDLEREVPATGTMRCPSVQLVTYRGETVPYHTPVRVYIGFRDRLRKFEAVVRDTAIEVYGRAPRQIRHIGTYNCRRIRLWPTLLSEHGVGNGIDIAGFDFPALKKAQRLPGDAPAKLGKRFEVRIKAHWNATGPINAVHAKFLLLLTERLRQRQDIFRVMLGPAYPGHKDHFHFDCAPWRMVVI